MSREQPRIMVVDDDRVTCELLCEVFAGEGFAARFEQSGEAALDSLAEASPDVLVSDIRMRTRLDGLALLDHVRRERPHTPVVLMTAFGSIETAIRAVKEGAFDYISKPFDIDALVATVRRALASRFTAEPPVAATEDEEQSAAGLVGRTPAMLEVYKMIARVSDSRAAVLITGESGTGKELVARAVHVHGPRHAAPFVAVNCGALAETLLETELFGHVRGSFTGAVADKRGIFEQAGDGTVFLDEVSEMSAGLQVKLLRVLQEREVTPVGGGAPVSVRARVIAASNRDTDTLMSGEGFRQDLLYRLNVINIHLPPLRERREDIPLLVAHFLRKHTPAGQTPPTIDEDARRRLSEYPWPGNVRELENAIERAVTLNQGGSVTPADLPAKIVENTTRSEPDAKGDDLARLFEGLPSIQELERRYMLHVLEATGGNRKRAAEIMDINRKTLYRMAERYGIEL
ncbi:MAG: two-component system, NtrC family, response regulator AtoC [Acidobacteriota bacterium]|jgi:DNA-binding NtrC family response regulator|nr:two-component system, NtrC family, response regulator AtoC [Acidobacteriota bacterium]